MGCDTDIGMLARLIISKNRIIQCNYMCWCRTRHMSDTGIHLIQGVSVLHSYEITGHDTDIDSSLKKTHN